MVAHNEAISLEVRPMHYLWCKHQVLLSYYYLDDFMIVISTYSCYDRVGL